MIRVVIDTNVVVSAALTDDGPSASIVYLAVNGDLALFVSLSILAEYEEVLNRPRLKLDRRRIDDMLALIRQASTVVQPSRTLSISRDESDNRFYECAEVAEADYLVTGNTRHFLQSYKSTRIVTPRELVELLGFADNS